MLTNALIYCVIQKLSVQKSFHLKTKTSFNYIALTEPAPSANAVNQTKFYNNADCFFVSFFDEDFNFENTSL